MASDLSKDNSVLQLKQFWQTYNCAVEDTNVSTREKLDVLRSLLFFLQKLLTSKKINEASYEQLQNNLTLQYHSLLDKMDKEKGCNNYSEMISVITEGKRNESQSWVSELSWDNNKRNLLGIKDLIHQNKKEPQNMNICFSKRKFDDKTYPVSRNNDLLHMHNQQRNERTSSSQNMQQPLQEYSKTPISNEVHVPRFGKRKHNYAEQETVNKGQMKKQVKNSSFGQQNISCMNGRTKAIVYRHENDGTNNNKPAIEKLQVEKTGNPFLTAKEQLRVDMKKSGKMPTSSNSFHSMNYGQTKKSLGARRGVSGKFVPPIGQEKSERKQAYGENKSESLLDTKYEEFEWMKNIDPKMIELIENEIMDQGPQVNWNDIAGLEFAKTTIQEIVIWPMLRPDIFTGLRGPPKGLLLFGPPGTGKTLIGKCIASQSNAMFFSISASSLTSKWIGDGEKMVRALFGVARCHQPAVIFIDEIDSLLTQRSETEHESSRRIKTEFLVQLDGATASSDDRLLVVGATNRPQELDEAARRRLVKRLYIPLPDGNARKHIVNNLMSNQPNSLLDEGIDDIISKTDGFSGADMATLCREAALGPIRNITDIRNINADEVRPINITDFLTALKHVRPSVSQNDLQIYIDWNSMYGSGCGL